jgi:hypothetical protein
MTASFVSRLGFASGLVLASLNLVSVAHAYPVDPAKRAVNINLGAGAKDFVLAYDSEDPKVVYYAPKSGRTATINGMPVIGFGLLPTGGAVLNAQFEFGVFGEEKTKLFEAIQAAGMTPRPFPYKSTRIVPLTNGIDPTTGRPTCISEENPATGEMEEICDPTLYDEVSYSRGGPALGENVALTALLNKTGAAVMGAMLRGGNAIQVNLESEYYTAGTAFSAKITMHYDKFRTNWEAYAGAKGFLWEAEAKGFWNEEGLCKGRAPSECAIEVEYTDDRGQHINNVTIDPDNREAQEKVLQAIDRLKEKLQDEMLTPIKPAYGRADTSKPRYGYKFNAQWEHQHVERNAVFTFQSPRGVNVGKTVIPAAIACVVVDPNGDTRRNTSGDCQSYWQGTANYEELIARLTAQQ